MGKSNPRGRRPGACSGATPKWLRWRAGRTIAVRLGLRGFLPDQVTTLCEQRDNFLANMRQLDDPLQQNRMLQDLHNRNETLFIATYG